MKYCTHIINTPIGTIMAECDGEAITKLDFTDEPNQISTSVHPLLLQLENELLEYFDSKRTVFTLPLNPEGTPFQKEVWKILQKIPYGTTISYAQESKWFGNPKATRAVANANGKNPIAILIPCHRVIASGGGLGGYSGGIDKKEFLLKLENIYPKS
ncbi:MAG: methylated-DNA--[protein]-cysteine S-methyltransferase [Sulfuricurvum sp.]|uniref:methylated-DNA--[protein]-cysteine S-methyltransferase n=1 Tax=Sulfuricurvum sp. TaxID=2025608 RepID=UPI0026260BD7|nr:methylated-DNA--[protein]-cysteine S-methyltransferase [Sulfuricurvum sp.]MDD2829588.1 methylated-DNA--[protein]-cysteine S-methyltransferase [Sulfuricurvum sp.]MDD4950365.1 methylated-DNA--[protein]-cysteine S-methyltransferase [Sulfuricurvum sp.]